MVEIPSTDKMILVDAETAFDVFHLNVQDQTGSDPWHIAKTVRAIGRLCGDQIKLVFVVQGGKATEQENIEEFHRKELQLAQYFFDNKEIVSRLPSEKRITNVYKNVLRHRGIAPKNAIYLTGAEKIDPCVAAAGITIIKGDEEPNMWRRLKNFAFE